MIYRLGRRKKLHAEINVVPYIDVMLVLLIIFMVLSPLLIQGIDVNLPRTDTTKKSLQTQPKEESIEKNGNYYHKLREPDIANSLEELQDTAFVIFDANPEIEVVFKGDEAADFQSVAAAMAAIQSVGIAKIGIVTSGYDD